MHTSGNTILITGGGSGIGRGLAEALAADGNHIIVAGRRRATLDEVVAATPGMAAIVLDVADPGSITSVAAILTRDYPALNVVIHNAGIMRFEKAADGIVENAEAMVTTNLLGPIRLTAALLPHLLTRPHATIVTVSSGLAFVPLAATPTYCATKAAIHSYSESLREQLKATTVEVLEIVPPYVQTELISAAQATDDRAMPLADFIAETMALIHGGAAGEVIVDACRFLRNAEADGTYSRVFAATNGPIH
jgi:uncharacterized oxidoreductase